jgi:hypothetical protein
MIGHEEPVRNLVLDLSDLSIDDLDLNLAIPASRGRRARSVQHFLDRELNEEDVMVLIENPERGSETPSIIKLKQSHHKLAQLIAEGVPDVEASLITGYAQSRISILKSDPAFKELLAHYKGIQKEIFINVHERLSGMSLDALEEIHSRLEEKPEDFSIKQLSELVALGFDRAGFGPRSSQSIDLHVSTSELLSSVKDEIRKKSHGRIETLGGRLPPPDDIPSNLGLTVELEAGEYSQESGPGSQSPGPPVRSQGGTEAPSSGAQILPFERGLS